MIEYTPPAPAPAEAPKSNPPRFIDQWPSFEGKCALIKYRLTDSEFLMYCFGCTWKIPYSDIIDVRPGWTPFAINFTNHWPWKFTIIKRKTGYVRQIIINPENRDKFIADLKQKVSIRKG